MDSSLIQWTKVFTVTLVNAALVCISIPTVIQQASATYHPHDIVASADTITADFTVVVPLSLLPCHHSLVTSRDAVD